MRRITSPATDSPGSSESEHPSSSGNNSKLFVVQSAQVDADARYLTADADGDCDDMGSLNDGRLLQSSTKVVLINAATHSTPSSRGYVGRKLDNFSIGLAPATGVDFSKKIGGSDSKVLFVVDSSKTASCSTMSTKSRTSSAILPSRRQTDGKMVENDDLIVKSSPTSKPFSVIVIKSGGEIAEISVKQKLSTDEDETVVVNDLANEKLAKNSFQSLGNDNELPSAFPVITNSLLGALDTPSTDAVISVRDEAKRPALSAFEENSGAHDVSKAKSCTDEYLVASEKATPKDCIQPALPYDFEMSPMASNKKCSGVVDIPVCNPSLKEALPINPGSSVRACDLLLSDPETAGETASTSTTRTIILNTCAPSPRPIIPNACVVCKSSVIAQPRSPSNSVIDAFMASNSACKVTAVDSVDVSPNQPATSRCALSAMVGLDDDAISMTSLNVTSAASSVILNDVMVVPPVAIEPPLELKPQLLPGSSASSFSDVVEEPFEHGLSLSTHSGDQSKDVHAIDVCGDANAVGDVGIADEKFGKDPSLLQSTSIARASLSSGLICRAVEHTVVEDDAPLHQLPLLSSTLLPMPQMLMPPSAVTGGSNYPGGLLLLDGVEEFAGGLTPRGDHYGESPEVAVGEAGEGVGLDVLPPQPSTSAVIDCSAFSGSKVIVDGSQLNFVGRRRRHTSSTRRKGPERCAEGNLNDNPSMMSIHSETLDGRHEFYEQTGVGCASTEASTAARKASTAQIPSSSTVAACSTSTPSGSGALECQFCAYKCLSRMALRMHCLKKHDCAPNGNPCHKIKCRKCDAMFVSQSQLSIHYGLRHSSVKPARCPYCEYCSASKLSLSRHIQSTHPVGPGFRCDLCSQQFKLKSNLARHMLSHSDEKPHACTMCSISYKDKKNCRRHMWSVHNVRMQ